MKNFNQIEKLYSQLNHIKIDSYFAGLLLIVFLMVSSALISLGIPPGFNPFDRIIVFSTVTIVFSIVTLVLFLKLEDFVRKEAKKHLKKRRTDVLMYSLVHAYLGIIYLSEVYSYILYHLQPSVWGSIEIKEEKNRKGA